MADTRHREEVINVKLADALAARDLGVDAETIQLKGRPDVLVDLNGIKLVIEGRHEKTIKSLKGTARQRVYKGIGDISLALSYPEVLFTTKSTSLSNEIVKREYSGAIFHYEGSKIQESAFHSSSIDDLSEMIRNVMSLIVQDDVVRFQVEAVEQAINDVVALAKTANLFFKSEAVKRRLKAALAIDS